VKAEGICKNKKTEALSSERLEALIKSTYENTSSHRLKVHTTMRNKTFSIEKLRVAEATNKKVHEQLARKLSILKSFVTLIPPIPQGGGGGASQFYHAQ
jgi:hypothetical protein